MLPQFDYVGAVCMDYAVHMWGATIGRLNIYTTEMGPGTPIIPMATDRGNRWIRSRSTIILNSKTDRVRIYIYYVCVCVCVCVCV